MTTSLAHAQSTLHTAREFFPDTQLTNIDSQGRCQFQNREEVLSRAGNEIVRWSSQRSTTPGSAIALADGSWLAGQMQWPGERRVRIVSKWFETQEFEIDSLRAIMVNASASWPESQRMQSRMLSATGAQDVLWKRGFESATGIVTIQIKKSIDPNSPDRAAWYFKTAATNTAIEVPPGELAGITFSPILRRPTPACASCFLLHMIDGSRLVVQEFKRRDDGRIECQLASGVKLTSLDESDQFVLSISQITAQPAGVTWLSDMEPARYRLLESDSQVPWPLGRNRDLFGNRLFDAHGQAIEHALVIHSPAQVAYRGDNKTSRLLATLEILATPSGGSNAPAIGSAKCQVMVGRNGQLTSVWQSEVLRTGQGPVAVDAEISNSQLIVLLVDQADLGTLGDHVTWRDVRVVSE